MKLKDSFKFTRRITFRVLFLVIAVLLAGIGIVMGYYLKTQNDTILESKEMEIRQEAEILYIAIKNNMLAGEAPIAVELFRDFERANFSSGIGLFRADGKEAFSDNKTIREVNKNLKKDLFKLKPSVDNPAFNRESSFKKSVDDVADVFINDIQPDQRRIIIYKPLINQPKCSSCHGINHVVRGVIEIASPMNDVYKMVRNNIIFSIFLYALIVLILTVLIIMFLKKFVIGRILNVGSIVKGVGRGDFETKIVIDSADEIGELGIEINGMIDGLRERFKLTRFVSKSTLDHVRDDSDISLGGEKKTLTVLFSDIRNFTNYSEERDPEAVLEMLNRVMNLQSVIIHKYGGDIDKFVGDEIMAVFEGENMALRAVQAAEQIRLELKKMNQTLDTPVYAGIGINTGEMISGNMGSDLRIDRTVIGDSVNLGARLCSVAGKNTIVLSEFTYDLIRDQVEVNAHEPIKVKGKDRRVKIYTLVKTI
jgi:class 3 adenylate cyclase